MLISNILFFSVCLLRVAVLRAPSHPICPHSSARNQPTTNTNNTSARNTFPTHRQQPASMRWQHGYRYTSKFFVIYILYSYNSFPSRVRVRTNQIMRCYALSVFICVVCIYMLRVARATRKVELMIVRFCAPLA